MKLATLLTIGATIATASAASNITIKNFSGTAGLPLVDNAGAVIAKDDLDWDIGTFEQSFAATLGTLDTLTSDAAVLGAFTSARVAAEGTGSFNFDGLFSGTLATDDGGALVGSPLYAIAVSGADVMVFDFGGAVFPTQDGAGAAAVEFELSDSSDVLYGGDVVPVADWATVPQTLQNRFAGNGLSFNVTGIPEPSTGLLSLIAGLALLARRRR